jgi:hypothetical protein
MDTTVDYTALSFYMGGKYSPRAAVVSGCKTFFFSRCKFFLNLTDLLCMSFVLISGVSYSYPHLVMYHLLAPSAVIRWAKHAWLKPDRRNMTGEHLTPLAAFLAIISLTMFRASLMSYDICKKVPNSKTADVVFKCGANNIGPYIPKTYGILAHESICLLYFKMHLRCILKYQKN